MKRALRSRDVVYTPCSLSLKEKKKIGRLIYMIENSWFRTPLLSSLIEKRPICLSVAGSLGVHFTLVSFGLPAWPCPIRYGLGIPCPGCGLSRAILLLLNGNWQQALIVHGFAPLAIVGMFFIVGTGILPDACRHPLVNQLKRLEKQTGITAWLLLALIAYWLIRLLIFPKILYGLVL